MKTAFGQRHNAGMLSPLLGRQVDASGLASWTAALNGGFSRLQVVTLIESSKEYRTIEVQAAYQQYLHRAFDASGLQSSLSFLNSGGAVEQLAALLASSREYNAHSNGTNDSWLDVFYQDALHRSLDADGRWTWHQAFAAGASRAMIASAILASDEVRQDLVLSYYLQFLDRPATPDAAALPWFQQLKAGSHDEAVIAGIITDAGMEFYKKTAS